MWNLRIFLTMYFFTILILVENSFLSFLCFLEIIFFSINFMHSQNLNQSKFHWLNQWFAFPLIHQWKNIFHCLISWLSLIETVEKIFSLWNQLIFTEAISGIWLIYSNLFLAIWISQISRIISRFRLIHIQRTVYIPVYSFSTPTLKCDSKIKFCGFINVGILN